MKLAILISSCDAFSDVWKPFFTLWFKYWPDCPYPLYLIANKLTYDDKRVTTIAPGPDKGWAINTIDALNKIPAKYILYIQEDYLLKARVDTDRIKSLLEIMEKEGAAYLRVFPSPGPDAPFKDYPDVGLISKGAPYRMSLQAGIWDKEVFLSLIKPGETGWQMEFEGTKRTNQVVAPFLSVTGDSPRPLPYVCTGVIRGKWIKEAVALCKKEGIVLDLNRRAVRTTWMETKEWTMSRVYWLAGKILPPSAKSYLRSKFRKK